MDFGHKKIRMDSSGDRLSNLPDDLIHKILSYIDTKHAIKTSSLSSRWRYIWTTMPSLNISNRAFHWSLDFSKFVTSFLSARNNQTEVSSVKLAYCGLPNEVVFIRILNYARSHNVHRLDIAFVHNDTIEFPLYLFRCQSLKHLTLDGSFIITPATLELPSLATLNLHYFTLRDDNTTDKCVGVFSTFAKLKNLTLKYCKLEGLNGFNICHPGLSSLTLEHGRDDVNVIAPQLKNLIIKHWQGVHLISTPNLSSLLYKESYKDDTYPLKHSDSNDLLHLEKVDICISHPSRNKANAHKIVCLLQHLHSVRYLTLNSEIIKLISSFVELISHQPSPFANLKSLEIYPEFDPVHCIPKKQTQPKVTMCTEVKNYLLDGSPGATFTMVSHEDNIAVMNVASARTLMSQLHSLLDKLQENIGTKKAPMKWHNGETRKHIKSYWEDLKDQYEKGYKNTCSIISLLQKIDEILAKLPTSHRDKVQARFSGLSAEAETIINSIMSRLKIQ